MVAFLSVLVIVGASLVVTRVATVALTLTGMSQEAARFQARSAFTGTGFTTSEAEAVLGHPVRRRIVHGLMLVGSAGVVTAIASLAAGFATSAREWEILAFGVALAVMLWIASSRWFDRALQPLIHRLLRRWTDLDVRDYAALLRIHGDYAVTELLVDGESWLADRSLADLRLSDEGVLVLGVHRDAETYLGAPRADVEIHPGDTLVLYGHARRMEDLGGRVRGPQGDEAHVRAIADQRVREIREQTVDRAHGQDPDPGRAVPAADGHAPSAGDGGAAAGDGGRPGPGDGGRA